MIWSATLHQGLGRDWGNVGGVGGGGTWLQNDRDMLWSVGIIQY